jgi:cell division protein FtsQ
MRDYKHVRVPRSYRSKRNRVVTKRVAAAPRRTATAGVFRRAAVTLFVLLLPGVLGYGIWEGFQWLTHAELFQVAGVDVKGVRTMSDDEVRQLAGMFTGQNIFRVNLDAATRRALADPWVRNVRIERSLPNRISMVITERVPRALLQAANGHFLMDREQVVIEPAGRGAGAGLPVIVVRDLRTSPRSIASGDGVTSALELLDELALRGGWDLSRVTIRADSAETVAVLYADHEFRLGTGNYDEKLRRLGEIVTDLNRRNLDYVSVELRPERQAAVMIKAPAKGSGGRRQGTKNHA